MGRPSLPGVAKPAKGCPDRLRSLEAGEGPHIFLSRRFLAQLEVDGTSFGSVTCSSSPRSAGRPGPVAWSLLTSSLGILHPKSSVIEAQINAVGLS
ncbi:hypothetical protein ZIOFF_018565 [Zingiber officinale]|uniref:Uncharacterized protein n=1 Tax=Zingiber officinale TaxID=94328 RepID=A0A8J5LIU7_ZINOF|nr:hypothetical protein ZIOFF_018565 [Zingiber officinale]